MDKILFFSENRLAYLNVGPSKDPKLKDIPDARDTKESKESEETQNTGPNKEKLDKFVEDEMLIMNADKIKNFMKNNKGKNSEQVNRKFFTDVLDIKKDVVDQHDDKRLNMVIKGFQKHLNIQFPKAKIAVDGKLGEKTLSKMTSIVTVENQDEMGELIWSLNDELDNRILNKTAELRDGIAKCKNISGWKNQNKYLWTKVLKLIVDPKGQDADSYMQNSIKQFQKYLAYKTGKPIAADGKFGKKSLALLEDYITSEEEANKVKFYKGEDGKWHDRNPKPNARKKDIAI